MRTIIITLLLSILFAGSPVHGQEAQQTDHVPGVVLVKFEEQALPNITQTIRPRGMIVSQVASVLDSVGFKRGRKLFENFMPSDTMATTRSGKQTRLVDLSRWYKLIVASSTNIPRLAKRLEQLPGIASASPNHILYVRSTTPDDPEFEQGNQWGLSNPNNPDADIHAPNAWNKNKGRSDVVVGVIDTGIDYNHHDLDPGDRSRVIQGYDFGNDDSDAMDNIGHGTGVAGAIGAITNNDRDVAGVMWNLQLMPLKASDNLTGITSTLAAEALNYARKNGVDIVNMSLSQGPCGGFYDPDCYSSPLSGPTKNAYLQGLTLVGSTGNNGQKEAHTPAAYWGVAAVGASDPDDTRDPNSTYGPHVNFVAPSGFQSTDLNNGTQEFGGPTSHAAAIASGVAGLILSESRDRNLDLTNDDIRHLMQQTAKDINSAQLPGPDDQVGHGRLNANAALEVLQPPNEVVHSVHFGGSKQQILNNTKYAFIDGGRPNNVGGVHFVDVYEVTGHVNFSTPFQSTPLVWFRDRGTKGWSAANPNREVPYVQITNVTKTGFDYSTFVYHTSAGWYPVSPSNVKIAFTAVGEPGTPPLDVTLSGPSWLVSGDTGTWTASVTGGSGTISYEWSVQPPGSGSIQVPGCSGSECSYTFVNDSDQNKDAYVYVSATRGSEQDGASMTVTVEPDPTPIAASVGGQGLTVRGLTARSSEAQTAILTWSTPGPYPPAPFVIEHRRDSTAAWSTLGTVAAADSVGADTSRGAAYRFRTEDLSVGTHQFRLQMRAEGAKNALTSRAVSAEIRMEEAYRLRAYPNPVRGQATVELAVKKRQDVQVRLYDVLGRRVATLRSGPLPAQELRRLRLDISARGLTSGTYFLRATGETFTTTEQITVVR